MIARDPRREDGFVLATAIILLMVMATVGLAVVAFTDTQQRQVGIERTRESSFRLGEAAMQGQVFQLGAAWPGSTGTAVPDCSASAASAPTCPDAPGLATAYTGVDYSTASCPAGTPSDAWSTSVRDNGVLTPTPTRDVRYYDLALAQTRPAWDANGDGKLWVRATSVARCRVQKMVALVQQNLIPQPFPQRVVTANWFMTTNKGNKVIVDTLGTAARAGELSVRCDSPSHTPCADYDVNKGQVSPDTTKQGDLSTTPAVSDSQLLSFKQQAIASGLYYPAGSCPTDLVGKPAGVAYMEGSPGGTCVLPGAFTAAAPGVLVVANGGVSLGANSVFYGLIYAANKSNDTGALVSIDGTAAVQGAVAVDGPGGVSTGASKANIVFDDRAFALIKGYAGAGIVQNSWRVLPNGQ